MLFFIALCVCIGVSIFITIKFGNGNVDRICTISLICIFLSVIILGGFSQIPFVSTRALTTNTTISNGIRVIKIHEEFRFK
jgi:hypothetical protein